MPAGSVASLVVGPGRPLRGTLRVPGDKSISHRAALLGALASGSTRIHGFLRAADCLSTLSCVRRLGAGVEDCEDGGPLTIRGGALREPEDVLDAGNSGTTIRLLTGVAAGQPFHTVVTGDASVRRRPMDRVAAPLRAMGARIAGRDGGRLAPLAILGGELHAIAYATPVASAQVKSAVLLAGLFAEGETSVREPAQSRDHTERMLPAFGAAVARDGFTTRVRGSASLRGTDLRVPGDLSSAAFFLVAATLVPGSELRIADVGLNPTRTGVLDALRLMGAEIEVQAVREAGGEAMGDLVVRARPLHGAVLGGELIPRTIDDLPALAVAAALAEGDTVIRDAAELRVKESDRIDALATQLGRLGARVEAQPDGLAISGRAQLGAGHVDSGGDHRIAMALAVAGLRAAAPVTIDDTACIETSFPGFEDLLRRAAGG